VAVLAFPVNAPVIAPETPNVPVISIPVLVHASLVAASY